MKRILFVLATIIGIATTGTIAMAQDSIPVPTAMRTDTIVRPGQTPPKDAKLQSTAPIKDAKVQTSAPQKRNSTTALLCSIIPGGGQIYNQQYWKLPIIVGAYTACYYAISWNNNNLMEYANAYRDIKSDKPLENTSWQNFIPYGANPESYVNNSTFHDTLRRGRDFFRRYRDLSIIISAGVYILVMVDAYVDAELSNFDISPNLTLSYSPTYISPIRGHDPREGGVGMLLALTF